MKRLLLVGKSAKQRAYIKQACGKSFLIEDVEKLDASYLLDNHYNAVILMLDEDPEHYLSDIEHYTLSRIDPMPPLIVATKKPESVYVRKALRRGALDYVDLDRHFFLIENRIVNIMKLAEIQPSHVNAVNNFLFYRCIGPAMIIEVSDDYIFHAVMINSAYYELTGLPKHFYDNSTNLLDTVLPEEKNALIETIQKAVMTGTAQTKFSKIDTEQTFRGTYRLMIKEEHSWVFLLTITDITERETRRSVQENIMKLPGMILFTYDVAEDTVTVFLNKKNKEKSRIVHEHKNILDPGKQKLIAPECYPAFHRAMTDAIHKKVSGNIDVRCLTQGTLKWFRMYYRSIPDIKGNIIRIVGRLDDLESEEWMDVKGVQSGLCDPETHLPTFRTASQFIDQLLTQQKQGTLILLYITGLDKVCNTMVTLERQIFLQGIVKTINNQFISTDIIGRFESECFMVFMPETTSRNVAVKRAESLIKAVDHLLPSDNLKANVGISIIGEHHGDLESIISEANVALWHAIYNPDIDYMIFENDMTL